MSFIRFVVGFLIICCTIQKVNAENLDVDSLRIGGSTTLLPIITNCANDFMEKYKTWNKIDSKLSKRDIIIFVSGGGSGFGIKSTINGTFDIGLASRNLKEKEKKLLGKHKTFLVGKDAVVIAANKDNCLAKTNKDLMKSEVAEIFSGSKKTYKSIDPSLPDDNIVLLVRDAGAGSAELMQKLIMGKSQISPNALQLPSQGALLKKLETNSRFIGYISSGLVLSSDKLYGFALDGVKPSNTNIVNGKYSFVRPLLMIVKDEPSLAAKYFIDYILTTGQKTVSANHYVPVD
jgi:phosphate transport system substrate-binding protein|tara:strand:+ start:4866 stop:5735 length:870 start_codon:yes stop_codon:yes gene_type:complete